MHSSYEPRLPRRGVHRTFPPAVAARSPDNAVASTTAPGIATPVASAHLEAQMIRVLMVDDDDLLRDLLRAYLEASGRCEIVGEASDGRAAISRAGELLPDIVILDITMPGVTGLDALPHIRRVAPRARILMHSNCGDAHRDLAFQRGAHAFCLKSGSLREVVERVIALATT